MSSLPPFGELQTEASSAKTFTPPSASPTAALALGQCRETHVGSDGAMLLLLLLLLEAKEGERAVAAAATAATAATAAAPRPPEADKPGA